MDELGYIDTSLDDYDLQLISDRLNNKQIKSNINKCIFNNAWRGTCDVPCDDQFCNHHINIKCVICGKQAVKECAYTGFLVCGAPLCETCEHKH